ncbi:MAG TPA: ribokinase [Ramlibacter sp.]|nr:ribokinase [Ramlibacter sp.]
MTARIVVVGSANTDFVLRMPQLPSAGETVLGNEFRLVQGGKGANQAVAAARLGAQVTLVARLGTDSFGKEALAVYQNEGIDTSFIVQDDHAHSGVALIMVNERGENLIAVAPGANGQLTPEDVMAARAVIEQANCVIVQLEIPLEAVEAAVHLARLSRVPVILNPAPARRLPSELLRSVDYLTPNETEAAILAGEQGATADMDSLVRLPSVLGVPRLVVTLGSRGACILEGGQPVQVPAFAVSPVDTTACGDAFNGALAVALARGESLISAVRYANAAGALAATRPGAQPSLPHRKEVEDFMASSGPSPADPAAGISN